MNLYYIQLLLSAIAAFAAPTEEVNFESPIGIDRSYRLDEIDWYGPGTQQPFLPPKPKVHVWKDAQGTTFMILPPAYRVSLQDAVANAAKTCGGGVKFKKRDLIGCMINQAEAYARDDSVIRLLDPTELRKFKLELRRGQRQLVELSRRFKDMIDLNRALLFVTAAFQTQTVGWTAGGLVLAGGTILQVRELVEFSPAQGDHNQGDEPDSTTSLPPPTQTSASCRPTGENDFPTDCADDDCQGKDQKKCTTGPERDCPCVEYGKWIEDEYDTAFGDAKKRFFDAVYAEAPLGCSFGTLGDYENGKAIMEPSAWCVCSTASTTAYYPTRTETGDAACAYTSLPEKTISPVQNPPPASTTEPPNPCVTQTVEVPGRCGVPACQHVLAANKGVAALCEEDYCFCDGVAVALLTSVVDGSTSLGCGYETLPTKDACPSKTAAPTVAPTAPPTAPTEPPKVNKPGMREWCVRESDCEKFTCAEDGRKAFCNYDVEPGAAFCRC